MNTRHQHIIFLIGRLAVGGVYLWSGITNLLELDGKADYAASKGLPAASVFVGLASLLLIAAGLSLATGLRPRAGVVALSLFLIPVTVVMHNFWALQGLPRIVEMHSFLGNLGLLGSALMFLAIPRPWPFSLEQWAASLRSMNLRTKANAHPVATTH
jgi:uncharacterized membrane protein YphA (DoxX/SURF4 family)